MNSKHHKMLNSKSLKFTLKVKLLLLGLLTKSLKFTLKVAIIRPKCSKPEKNYPLKKKVVLWGPPPPVPCMKH
jgi:hypothetical protein